MDLYADLVTSMPKDRKQRSISIERAKSSPLKRSSSRRRRSDENAKEWEEARCPVCMEHPHNAVLLICSSHGKGCRPYMCDTSYRHSNCLDQFRKSFPGTSSTEENATVAEPSEAEEGVGDGEGLSLNIPKIQKMNILCPLCRGRIDGWVVVEPARRLMNTKSRSCACETCEFAGDYPDLRKHARLEHPSVRPSRSDPERERNWRRLERQRDFGDFISTIRSAFHEEGEEDEVLPVVESGWMAVLLIRVFLPDGRSRSTSRPRTQVSGRRRSRRLWGESYDGDISSVSRDEDNESSDGR